MLAALWWWRRDEASTLPARVRGLLPAGVAVASGFVTVVATMLAIFAIAGAFDDLYHATISYNVFYSGETYASRFAMLGYLLRFPIERARVDGLWFVGGLGCAVILVTALVRRTRAGTPDLLPVLWVAAACLSIAVNGSRGLPQYFLQAAPGPGAGLRRRRGVGAGRGCGQPWRAGSRSSLVAVAVQRVVNVDKIVDYLRWDAERVDGIALARGLPGALRRPRQRRQVLGARRARAGAADHRARAGERDGARARLLAGRALQSERRSATRFFWSRPLIVGFGEGWPGYGAAGLLAELEARKPALVALQRRDWDPDTIDSFTWFSRQPKLVAWLGRDYQPAGELGNFVLFRRAPKEFLARVRRVTDPAATGTPPLNGPTWRQPTCSSGRRE